MLAIHQLHANLSEHYEFSIYPKQDKKYANKTIKNFPEYWNEMNIDARIRCESEKVSANISTGSMIRSESKVERKGIKGSENRYKQWRHNLVSDEPH